MIQASSSVAATRHHASQGLHVAMLLHHVACQRELASSQHSEATLNSIFQWWMLYARKLCDVFDKRVPWLISAGLELQCRLVWHAASPPIPGA